MQEVVSGRGRIIGVKNVDPKNKKTLKMGFMGKIKTVKNTFNKKHCWLIIKIIETKINEKILL